jgi:cob(I)alamin adenosyltransferase
MHVLGLIRATKLGHQIASIEAVQNILFRIGSLLASTEKAKADFNLPNVEPRDIELLETEIDSMTAEMPPLKSFVLPGSGSENAHCHLARTVCRRAERRVIELFQVDNNQENTYIITYLNRLSDYLFTLARYATHINSESEIKWLG